MSNCKIAFIGGGNMARSLIGGLVATGISSQNISVSEPRADLRKKLNGDFGVNALDENSSAVMGADVVMLAVKPQVLQEVVQGCYCKGLEWRNWG